MARGNLKETYLTQVYELFRKRGLNLTMDEISFELKITKKTLYNNFKSKDILMRTVMEHVIEDVEFKINLSLTQGKNAIEALFYSSSMMNKTLEELGPQLLNDSSLLLPDLKVLDHTNRTSFYSRIISDNLERGISEGLYRDNFNKDLITLFFTSAMAKIYTWNGSYVYLKDPFVFHSELVRYHLESIVNDMGREIIHSFMQK